MELTANKTLSTERRIKHRINCDYAAVVKGCDAMGTRFTEHARVINLSSSGISVVAKHAIQNGTEVSVRIALPTGSLAWGTSKLAATGIVIRNELQMNNEVGMAIRFHEYKFL
jgi:hypothetical protein